MRRIILAAFSATLLATSTMADLLEDQMGMGKYPCGLAIAMVKDGSNWDASPSNLAIMSWAEGFVSGMNTTRKSNNLSYYKPDSITDEEFWARIIGACKRNEKMSFSMAVLMAMQDMQLQK